VTRPSEGRYALNDSAEARVTWDNAALAALESGPSGFIVRDLVRRGQRVQDAAQAQVRLGHVGGGPGGRGNLKYSIVKRLVHDSGDLPTMLVGSDNPIALLHHEGTRAHEIRPRTKRVLVFVPKGGGPWVYARRVRHPGTRPSRYLTDHLNLATE